MQLTENASPKVLEDAFTSIHQNLLVIISQLTASLGLEKVKAPTEIESFKELIKNKSIKVNLQDPNKKIGTKFLFGVADESQIKAIIPAYKTYLENISLIGIDMDTNNLIYSYNMPLRGHSCFFKLIFNKNKNEAKLVAEFVFQNIGSQINGLEKYLKGKKTKAPEITLKKGSGDKSVIYTSPIKLHYTYYTSQDLLEDLEILGNLTTLGLD